MSAGSEAAQREQRPAGDGDEQRDDQREPVMSAVGEAAGERRDQRAGGTGEAEQADHALAVVVGRGGEQERDRGPQHREPDHGEHAERHAPPQHGLLGDQREHGAQELGVAQPFGGGDDRQPAVQRERQGEHHGGSEREDQSPAPERGDQPAQRAGGEDSDQQAAHDRPHDLAALLWPGEARGERHDDHGDDRQRAERGQRRGEHQEGRCGGACRSRRGGAEQHPADQPPALEQVAERDQQRQPDDVAHLRAGHE